MKIVLVLLAILPLGIWAAYDQIGLNQGSPNGQKFMSYMVGFFQESVGISYEDCNYFPSLRSFSNNRDISRFSKILNSWMCDSPFTKELAKVAAGINQLTRAFLNAFEGNRSEQLTFSTTEVPTTTPRIETKMVLYVGNKESNPEIDIYEWSDAKKIAEKRTSVATKFASNCLVIMDKTHNRLISLDASDNNKQQLEVFDLKGDVGKPELILSSESDNAYYRYVALHSSGMYIMVTDGIIPNVVAMKLMEDGSLKSITTYTQLPEEGTYAHDVKFHPKAMGVLAVVYTGLEKMVFLRFDSATEKLTQILTNPEIKSAYCFTFTHDGKYMYVVNSDDELITFKITVDVDKNEVTDLKEKDRFAIVNVNTDPLSIMNLVVSPSSKFLYVLSDSAVIMCTIDPATAKPSPNGFYPVGGAGGIALTMSPDGTHLVVSHEEKGIMVLNIKEDGKLEALTEIKYTKAPTALLYTWK